MASSKVKKLELTGKKIFSRFMSAILGNRGGKEFVLPEQPKILVYRLDERIGNGLLLLPLLQAIRTTRPDAQIHFHICQPVAGLVQLYGPKLADRVWSYNQRHLLMNPLRYLHWLLALRKENYDLAISSHNPDNFSQSQAVFGRFIRPKFLTGFDWKDARRYYDSAIAGRTFIHYADAQLDLWRQFYPQAQFHTGGLTVPEEDRTIYSRLAGGAKAERNILIWLGATGNKKLPVPAVEKIIEVLQQIPDYGYRIALGPADGEYKSSLPEHLQKEVILWNKALSDTAIFFSAFDAFVSGDTGPLHLAAALGVPTFSIFLNSNLKQYGYNIPLQHVAVDLREISIEQMGIDLRKFLLEIPRRRSMHR
ncbi:MAG: hypothetical protein Kow0037_01300 [Calditrichia bacterium]